MGIFKEDLQCPTKLTRKKNKPTKHSPNFSLSLLWKQPSQLPDPTHTDASSNSKPHTKSCKGPPRWRNDICNLTDICKLKAKPEELC